MENTIPAISNLTAQPERHSGLWDGLLRLTRRLTVRVYHGYGDADRILVQGHVLARAPIPKKNDYPTDVFRNTLALLRLFAVKPAPGVRVLIRFGKEEHEVVTREDGFFSYEWKTAETLQPGSWMPVRAVVAGQEDIFGDGKIYVPPPARYAFVSDIDDTFLISHAANLAKRLEVVLTKNPRTRQPFEAVVEHYCDLALAHTTPEAPNPFFYVSSSEWNLYEYIKEFCRHHGLPEGVFLLREIKQLQSFLKTGMGNHNGKYDRIARIMAEFPKLNYVLLGDDTQHDPEIYLRLVEAHPGLVQYVYMRHRVKSRLPAVRKIEARMKELGVEVCYFSHSQTAREHSRRMGLTGMADGQDSSELCAERVAAAEARQDIRENEAKGG
jgi:phosphatidate phosphatase APP1